MVNNNCIENELEKTEEYYREELKKLIDNMSDVRKLRFYYIYMNGLEKGDN